jgi:hypothetical protein
VESVWLCPWLPDTLHKVLTITAQSTLPNINATPFSPHTSPTQLPAAWEFSAALRRTVSTPQTLHATSFRRASVAHLEMPWWIYSSFGMHLLFPSTLSLTRFGADAGVSAIHLRAAAVRRGAQEDQELQFDREVLPVGVSLADAAIIGMTQRLHRAPRAVPLHVNSTWSGPKVSCSVSHCFSARLAQLSHGNGTATSTELDVSGIKAYGFLMG